MQLPDLLEPKARLRLDARLFAETLTFAFAAGNSPDAFERVLKSYSPAPSPAVAGSAPLTPADARCNRVGTRASAMPRMRRTG